MEPSSPVAIRRALLTGLLLLSILPWRLGHFLASSGIYDIRVGGLHPSDILGLHWVSAGAVYFPFVILGALALSVFRPRFTAVLLVGSTTAFVVYVLFFLSTLATVVALHA